MKIKGYEINVPLPLLEILCPPIHSTSIVQNPQSQPSGPKPFDGVTKRTSDTITIREKAIPNSNDGV